MEMDEVALQGLGPFATTESQRRVRSLLLATMCADVLFAMLPIISLPAFIQNPTPTNGNQSFVPRTCIA